MTNQSDKLDQLFQLAVDARANGYAPYSNHPVGSALRTEDGSIFSGCNFERANIRTLCAEGSAVAHMIVKGHRKILDIVVVGPGDKPCTPCGDCRQLIREFADENTRIHIGNRDGKWIRTYTMDELLPQSFGPEDLPDAIKKP